jgi:hypothetical protein
LVVRAAVSDERLRTLERAWQESGSAQAEAAYLLERVRVGDLGQSKLELAALCGHQGAGLAANSTTLWKVESTDPPNEWTSALEPWGKEVSVRGAVAAGWSVLGLWEDAHPGQREPRSTIEAAEAWLLCPCDAHAASAQEAADAVSDLNGGRQDSDPASFAAAVAMNAAWAAGNFEEEAFKDAAWAFLEAWKVAALVELAAPPLACVQSELVSWALGYGDPVQMRGAKRGEVDILPEDLAE